jgi:hypothetical protein
VSSPDLIRWGGLAAMLAGVVWIANSLLALTVANTEEDQWLDILFIVAVLLTLAGLLGLHALQKENYGRIGRAGFYLVVISSLVQIVGLVALLAGSQVLDWLILIGNLGVLVGFVLYGAATMQARVLPRWCGVGLIVGLPVTIALGDAGAILFGLLWLALGYILWSRREAIAEQPRRVS